jgi:hypothetical protein
VSLLLCSQRSKPAADTDCAGPEQRRSHRQSVQVVEIGHVANGRLASLLLPELSRMSISTLVPKSATSSNAF